MSTQPVFRLSPLLRLGTYKEFKEHCPSHGLLTTFFAWVVFSLATATPCMTWLSDRGAMIRTNVTNLARSVGVEHV